MMTRYFGRRGRTSGIILLLALAGILLFGGCWPGSGETPPAPTPTSPTQTSTQTPAPGENQVLNLYGSDPLTLDPALSSDAGSNDYVTQIFSGLVRLDDDLKPAADIAQDWKVSSDGRTFTFTLRRGVKFHDGREVKAADFKYSWERAASPATGSLTVPVYLGDVVGVREVLEGRTREISGVKVTGDYTLEVTIDAPKSYFLSKLTYPTAFVVDRANVESGREWFRNPNGTGPFRLEQWVEDQLLVLKRNPLYYGKMPNLGTVNFAILAGVPMSLYETGQIDVTGVSLFDIERASDESGPFYQQLMITPELSLTYIGFNHSKPPFDDVNVRLAFSYAVDKDKLVSLVFKNMVERADGILPPGIPGFNQDLAGLSYDIARAKSLIAASRYGSVANLPPITLTTSGYGGAVSGILEAIIYEWRQNLGVEVEVRQMEPERFFYFLKEEKDEMFSIGWIADYPHPQDFLDILFHSQADNNYGEYSNPEVDALLDKAGTEQDSNQSFMLYRQAEQKMVDDAAAIPLFFGKNYFLVRPYVKGYELNPQGVASLSDVSVER